MEEDQIIGWLGKAFDIKAGEFTPAVDVMCEWKGSGRQVLVTVIAPYKDKPPVSAFLSHGSGFEMTLADGRLVSYAYGSGKDAGAICKVGDNVLTLTQNGGSETSGNGQSIPVIKPQTFRWHQADAGEVPRYR
jgi:hypothetical protein